MHLFSFLSMALITTIFLVRLTSEWVKKDEAKDFIFTYIFHSIITSSLKYKSDVSISFTGSEFNKTSFNKSDHNIYLTHSLNEKVSNNSQSTCSLFASYIYQPKIKCKGGSYFYKNQKCKSLEIERKTFRIVLFQRILIFHIRVFFFFQKMLDAMLSAFPAVNFLISSFRFILESINWS